MRDMLKALTIFILTGAALIGLAMCHGCGVARYTDGEATLFIGRVGIDSSIEGAHFERGPDGVLIAADKADSVSREDLLKAILDKLP